MLNFLRFSLFLCTSLLAVSAAAEGWPTLDGPLTIERSGQQDVAIVVGVEDYLVLPDVKGASTNAADWEKFFRDHMGIATVFSLRDASATREEILLASQKARAVAGRYGTIWFVFIGHGAPSAQGTGRLIGADGQQTAHSVATRSVGQDEIASELGADRRGRTIMVVDACFSGMDNAGAPLMDGLQPVVATSTPLVPEAVTVFTAAGSNEFAGPLPGAQRPAFSYLMLGALRGWADSGDGRVTAGEAVRFAQNELRVVVGRTQTPQLLGNDQLILTSGVSEPRPAAIDTAVRAAPVATVVADAPAALVARTWNPNPVTDDFAWAKVHLGAGFVNGIDDVGLAFSATPGIKFTRGKRWDVRGGVLFGTHQERTAIAPHVGDVINSAGIRYTSIENERETFITAALGPGVAYRIAHTGQGWDRTIYGDTFFGLQTGQRCREYVDDSTSASCVDRRRTTEFALGARFGGELPVLDLAATAFYRLPDDGDAGAFVVGVLAGFSIDR